MNRGVLHSFCRYCSESASRRLSMFWSRKESSKRSLGVSTPLVIETVPHQGSLMLVFISYAFLYTQSCPDPIKDIALLHQRHIYVYVLHKLALVKVGEGGGTIFCAIWIRSPPSQIKMRTVN